MLKCRFVCEPLGIVLTVIVRTIHFRLEEYFNMGSYGNQRYFRK